MKTFKDLNIGDCFYEMRTNITRLHCREITSIRCRHNEIAFEYRKSDGGTGTHQVETYKINFSEYKYPKTDVLLFSCKESVQGYLMNIITRAEDYLGDFEN